MSECYEAWRRKYEAEVSLNYRAFAEQRDEIRRKYPGQWIGFAHGRVIAAGPDEDAVITAMNSLDPQAESGAVFRAEDEPAFEAVESVSSELLPE